jgi:hypothetical protein
MKVDEIAGYWQELAKKSGLNEDQTKKVLEALGDEPVAKAFTENFRTASEFSSGLDKERAAVTERLTAAEQKAAVLEEWYEKEAKPAFERNLQGVSSLQQYQELYGPLDGTAPLTATPNNGNQPPMNAVTREELEEMFRQQSARTVDLTKAALIIGGDYQHRFKKPLSSEELAELETSAVENRLPLDKAYEMWIAPKVAEQEREALTAKFEKEKEDAVRDALSQHNLPVDNKPPEHHPFFHPEKAEGDEDKGENAFEAKQKSKSAFLSSWQS